MALHADAPRPRLFAVLAACLIALGIVGPATVSAVDVASSATISANELTMLTLLSKDRSAHGLVAVRTDPRLMAIARARSADMAANDYFSHTQPDGRKVFDILGDAGIAWYAAGEIIAWNTYPTEPTTSVGEQPVDGLAPATARSSSRPSYNYVGVGPGVSPVERALLLDGRLHQGPGPDRRRRRARLGEAHGRDDAARRGEPDPGPAPTSASRS